MSANVCFIAAVLVAIAFTLASTCPTIPKPCPTIPKPCPTKPKSCPTIPSPCPKIPKPCPTKPKSCHSVDVPKVCKPDYTYTDFSDLYERLPRNQCVKFFEKLEFVDILPAYNAYRDCIDDAAREAAREAYLELIKKYYSQCPDKFVLEEIIEFINSIPDECGSDDFPSGQIVYTPRGVDLLDFYESCGSADIVIQWFKFKCYTDLLVKYQAWKSNVYDKNLKLSYRQCLYELYRGQPQMTYEDVLKFHDFDNSYKPACGGSFPVPRGLIPDGCGNSYDIPSYQIVYTPKGKDLNNLLESCGSSEVVFEFFISKGYFELAAKYFYWKINVSNKQLKFIYRTFLYALYKGQVPNFKPDITQDCIDFHNFDNSFKPGCGDEFPLLRSPTSSSIDIFSIFEQYTPDNYCNFFNRHNIPELTQLYTTYQNGGGKAEKLAFLAALKTYFTPEKPDDFSQIYELIFESINGFPIDSIGCGCDDGPTVPRGLTKLSPCPTIPKTCSTKPSPCPTKPKSCHSVDVPKVFKPDYTYTDFSDLYERLPRKQCVKFFEKLDLVDILPAYNAYRDCIDDAAREAAREAYLELIKKYYSQCPDKFVLEEIIEFINSIPDECGSDDFPSGQIVYTPRGVDLLDFYESCGSADLVIQWFKFKGYTDLLVKYQAWKSNVYDKNLKLSYRQCLYELYRGHPQKTYEDVLQFYDFENSYKPACGGSFPVPRGLIPDGCGNSYDIPSYQIVYTPNGKDLNDFLESFGSSEVVFEFFISKGYYELAEKYFYWKINVSNKQLKFIYRTFLYALYKGQVPNFKPDITQDCIDFYNFDNSFKPGCGDEFPLLRSPTSSSIDIFSIFEQYTPDNYCSFFNRHNIPELTQLYTTYQNGGGNAEKLAFLAALKSYYTQKPDDFPQIYELIFGSINGFPIDSISCGCDGGSTGTSSGDSFSFSYTETKTTTTSSGPTDIEVPPCGPVQPKSCGCGPPPGVVIKPKCGC